MKAFVTGATGFMGSAVVRRLLEEGIEIRALVREGSDARNLEGLEIERVRGDLGDYDSIRRGMEGCEIVFHLAAQVAFWLPPDRLQSFYDINVQGSKNVFQAAHRQGVDRVVYTSTVSTIGSFGKEEPTTEEHSFNLWDMCMDYERSKYSAEFEAWRFAARGLPLVSVLPTAPVGPRDLKPNPLGKLILDFLGRKLPRIGGGANFIHVDDVADGHILAAQNGEIGERYILGDANLSVSELFQTLENISGVPAPKLRVPHSTALALAHLLELISNHITHEPPLITVPMTKFSSRHYYVDTSKAETELGFKPKRGVAQAITEAIAWFLDNGYVPLNDRKCRSIREHIGKQAWVPAG